MRTYMVGYDLNSPRASNDYSELIEAIKNSFHNWWHYLDSTWLIKTNLNTVQIRDRLTPLIDEGDELLVARLTGEAAWVGFDETVASPWLKTNLSLE